MPEYGSTYGRSLADLMRQRGDREAEMYLRQGDIAAQGWAQAGQSITNAVSGWQRNVAENRQRELDAAKESRRAEVEGMQIESTRMDLDTKKRTKKGQETERAVLPLARRENGIVGYDRDLIQREMETAGHADMVPDIFARLDEQEAGHLKVVEARRDAIAGDAWRVVQGGSTDIETFDALADLWTENDLAPKREIDALRKVAKQEGVARALFAAVQSSPKYAELLQKTQAANAPDLATVAPGASVYDKRNPEAGAVFTAPQEPKAANLQPKEVLVNGKPAMAAFNPQSGQWQDQQGQPLANVQPIPPREPQGPAPSFQRAEVLNDAGERVVANYDSRTGKMIGPDGQVIANPRPIPSAMETQDSRKFSQAGPILDSVSELSEKINTQQGLLAKMAGGAKKVAAKGNYDDDVAEYEALISGFTPLVARALGHTGVLTQQDVDSVKALFPKPGDSKTLRDRKITRINSIVGQLESGARTTPAQQTQPGTAKPGGQQDGGGWTTVDGVRIRRKPGS